MKKLIVIFCMIGLTILIGITSIASAQEGVWHLDEGQGNIAYDSSSYGNHGTIYGAQWTTGKVGSALHFQGGLTNDRVEVPDSNSLDFIDNIILEAWVKPDVLIERDHPWEYHIVGKWSGNPNNPQWRTGYFLAIGASKEYPTYPSPSYLALGLGFGSGVWEKFYSVKDNWNAGEWYHIMATYDKDLPSGNVKLYINDVLDAQYDEHKSIATNNLPLFINTDPSELWHPYVRYFPGVIDEVHVSGVVPEPISSILFVTGGTLLAGRRFLKSAKERKCKYRSKK